MFNTYGLRSINCTTFNRSTEDNLTYPRPLRNIVITALRINNAVLNVMGYIPVVSFVSGCVRMGIGSAMLAATLAFGDRKAMQGAIIGRWYDEALKTGIAQIVRGALEALVPFGWAANAALDLIATPINLSKECSIEGSMICEHCMNGGIDEWCSHAPANEPHSDVDYPFPFFFLHLV